ncbi:MAG: hypothetical protein CVT93_01120 [Bacteroidetes bacterium HGW-Bacteroidetes-10]|nr:MAG: hypothetical protein CVT93_01120 [Bacteroidetes bacterium HGW-Bacteroidetes-10]
MKVFQESFCVKSYETDMNALLKPCSFMHHLQEMANLHAASLGFGYDNLIEKGILWVLSRVHVKFYRMPAWREEVIMETWHKGSEKLFGLRDYKMDDLFGNRLAEITSSWLIIGTASRRLQRIEQHLGNDHPSVNKVDIISEPAPKLISPENMTLTARRRVEYSDMDLNLHTNNTRYLEWAIDSVDQELIKEIFISEIIINFNSESRMGEEIDIYSSVAGESIFVEARRGETSVAQIQLKYQKR